MESSDASILTTLSVLSATPQSCLMEVRAAECFLNIYLGKFI